MRPDFQNQVDKVFGWISLNIEFCRQSWFQSPDIQVSDMPFIGAWMDRNSISTKLFTIECHLQDIWQISSPGISQGGDFIDIDT
jgi:hypothetical protein